MVILRFEWHNPILWQIKLPPPRAELNIKGYSSSNQMGPYSVRATSPLLQSSPFIQSTLTALFCFIEPSKKPGKCPRLSIEAIQGIIECPPPYPPIHECIVDRDCDENEKCCSDGCSFKCTQPVSIATVEPTTAVELTVDVRGKTTVFLQLFCFPVPGNCIN